MKSNSFEIGTYMGARLRSRCCVECDRPMVLSVSSTKPRIRCHGCAPAQVLCKWKPAITLCKQCAVGFMPDHPLTLFCSAKCRVRFGNKKKQMAARDRTPRPCRQCSETFTLHYGSLLQMYCSHDCRRAFNNARTTGSTHRRRAKKYGGKYEHFDPKTIFERDGWACQICGVAANGAAGTPTAPELDHIVPLSKGGDHTPANTQCACRACNQSKGAKMEVCHA